MCDSFLFFFEVCVSILFSVDSFVFISTTHPLPPLIYRSTSSGKTVDFYGIIILFKKQSIDISMMAIFTI